MIMTTDQAEIMINLLSEISNKLFQINTKISGDRDLDDVWRKLNEIGDTLQEVSDNTSMIG